MLNAVVESIVRSKARAQARELQSLGADTDSVCDGMAVLVEEFCSTFSLDGEKALTRVLELYRDRQRKKAAADAGFWGRLAK
jgi:hypothetical protein